MGKQAESSPTARADDVEGEAKGSAHQLVKESAHARGSSGAACGPEEKPPETKYLESGPPATSWTDTTPGLSSEMVGTWLGITAYMPSPPGRMTISTLAFSYRDLVGTVKVRDLKHQAFT